MRHREAIGEGEHLVGKDGLEFRLKNPIERVLGREPGKGGVAKMLIGAHWAKSRAEVWRVQGGFFLIRKDKQLGAPTPFLRSAKMGDRRRVELAIRLGPIADGGRHPVGKITAEKLIGPVARDRDLHMLRDQLGQEIRRDHSGERLVEMGEDATETRRKIPEMEHFLMVLGSKTPGDPAGPVRVGLLAGSGGSVGIGQREGLDGLW